MQFKEIYDSSGRIYKDIKTGLLYPSVTTIINCMQKEFEGLNKWSIKKAMEHVQSILDVEDEVIADALNAPNTAKNTAASTGSNFHYLVEEHIKGRADRYVINEPYLSMYNFFKEWIDMYKVRFISSEQIVYNENEFYAGRQDIKCIIDDKVYVVDVKTTKYMHEKKVAMQLSAYYHCNINQDVERVGIIKISKDGFVWKDLTDLVEPAYIAFLGLRDFYFINYMPDFMIERLKQTNGNRFTNKRKRIDTACRKNPNNIIKL